MSLNSDGLKVNWKSLKPKPLSELAMKTAFGVRCVNLECLLSIWNANSESENPCFGLVKNWGLKLYTTLGIP
jgi:hypothetical protein